MAGAAVVMLILACCAAALVAAPVSRPRRAAIWWQLEPINPECDVDEAEVAVKRMSARRRRTIATIAHVGSDSGRPGLFLGVSASRGKQAEEIAGKIADAGGCRLGEESAPPRLPRERRRWWLAVPEVSEDRAGEELEGTAATTVHQREMLLGFCARFSDLVDPALVSGEAWVVSFTPHKGAYCAATAMTTNPELGEAWAGGSQEMWVSSRPSPSGLAAGTVGLVGLVLGLGGMGVISLGDPNGVTAAMGLIATVVGTAGLWQGWTKPRRVRKLEQFWHLPVGRKRSRRGSKWSPVPSALVAGWANGGESTAVQAHDRMAPDALTVESNPGVRLGEDEASKRDIFLAYKDRYMGLFCVGDPGSGKTTLLLNVLRGDVISRLQGREIAVLWIETKGKGAERAAQVIRDAGWNPLVISAASLEGIRLDLVDWENPPRSASLLVNAMQFAFEAGDIHARSVDVLNAVFNAVLALPPQAAMEMGFNAGRPDVMQMAWWMLGGDQQGRMPKKARAVAEKYAPEAYAAFADYVPPHLSKHQSEQAIGAPRNKVRALMACSGLFSGYDRQYVSLEQLIGTHQIVVLDLSPPRENTEYTESTATHTAALVMFCIWNAIKNTCHGWQDLGKSVAVYSDELRDVAGLGDSDFEVVEELGSQGRDRGVLPVFATQWFNQIRPSTLDAVSFGSLVFFRQAKLEIATDASEKLGETYSPAELSALEVGRGAARLMHNGIPQPAFTLHPDNL